MRSIGSVPWALADQMLISASNFIAMILLARAQSQSAFGRFTLVYLVLLFFNSVQSGIVTQPHNVLGVTRRGDDYRIYTSSTALGQLLLSALAALLGLTGWGVAVALGWEIAPLLLALVPATVAWQILELTRRILYTEGRIVPATMNDWVSCGGQSLIVVLLWRHRALTGERLLYAIALCSLAGGALGLWQIRRSISARISWTALKDNWHFGKWVVGGEVVGHWLSAQSFVYLAAATLGAAAAGVLKAIHTLFGPTRILSDVMCTMLPIRFSRALSEGGARHMDAQLIRTCLITAPIFAAYCLGMAIFARPILWLLYGERYVNCAPVLCVYGIAAFTSYMMMIVAAGLRAHRMTRRLFDGQLYGSLLALPVGWAAIRLAGVQGAAVGMLISYGLTILFLWRTYRSTAAAKTPAKGPDEPGSCGQLRPGRGLEASADPPLPASGLLLRRVLDLIDRADIRYCITHGYESYPQEIASDVDMVIPPDGVNRLKSLLAGNERWLGARIVQWMRVDSCYVVLMGVDQDGAVHHLCLDISTDYRLGGHVFLRHAEILESRRRFRGMWVPAPPIEFACCLGRRVMKRQLAPEHAARLNVLYAQDGDGCRVQVERFFTGSSRRVIQEAAAAADWTKVQLHLPRERTNLVWRALRRRPLPLLWSLAAGQARRIGRWCRPRHGLHIVLLGPDGAGKSRLAKGIRQSLAPGFFNTSCRSFPPALLNRPAPAGVARPHQLPQRSWFWSVARAVCYWMVYSTLGHLFTIRLERMRFSLSLHDRHFLDTLVDPRRYRYSGPRWLLEMIWRLIPKPDLVLVLDAPPAVIQSRKQEVSAEETARQCRDYRALARVLPMARSLNSDQPPDQTRAAALRIIISHLALRTRRQLHLRAAVGGCENARRVAAGVLTCGRRSVLAWKIGEGEQADIYGACRADLPSASAAPPQLVVKLFGPGHPEVVMAVSEEFDSLRHLQSALDGQTLQGWIIRTPSPVSSCTHPLAVTMSWVPGQGLHLCLSGPGPQVDDRITGIARALASALERYWLASGRIYGDCNLKNVLCDPRERLLALVDPGMPEHSYLCESVSRRWYPASRDVAYMLFDAATSIRANLWSARLRRRQWRLLAEMIACILRRFQTSEEACSFLAEVGACAQVHLGRIRIRPSPVGAGRLVVRHVAGLRIAHLLRRLASASHAPHPQWAWAAGRSN